MATFNLPDSAENREVPLSIPKRLDAYFAAYYKDTKKDGETPSAFLLRNIGMLVAAHHARKKMSIVEKEHKGASQIINNDLDTFAIEEGLK